MGSLPGPALAYFISSPARRAGWSHIWACEREPSWIRAPNSGFPVLKSWLILWLGLSTDNVVHEWLYIYAWLWEINSGIHLSLDFPGWQVQWIRTHLPTQGTGVWSLVWEDSTCIWATKLTYMLAESMCLEPCSTTREAAIMRSPRTAMKSSPCFQQLEKASMQQQRPSATKIKNNK